MNIGMGRIRVAEDWKMKLRRKRKKEEGQPSHLFFHSQSQIQSSLTEAAL